jgi:hypothetical protein
MRWDDASAETPSIFGSYDQDDIILQLFPELFPRSPSIDNRPSFQAIENAYLEKQKAVTERYPCLRRARRLDTSVVNGYLKFVMTPNDQNDMGNRPQSTIILPSKIDLHHRNASMPGTRREDNVARLPPRFESIANIDTSDRKILRFCRLLCQFSISSDTDAYD